MNKEDLIAVRDVRQGDIPFIFSTWLKGIYYGGDKFFRKIPKDVFFSNYHKVLERILQTPGVVVKVTCLKEDDDVLIGYCVYRQAAGVTVLDWVFCKKDWRNTGLARDMLPPSVEIITHLTRPGEAIAAAKYPKAVFNPFLT
jgi:hypothetical protein